MTCFNFLAEKNGLAPTKVKKAPPAPSSKKKDKGKEVQKSDEPKQVHPWLAGTLKGHTGGVLSLDFSFNGKFLASVAEGQSC